MGIGIVVVCALVIAGLLFIWPKEQLITKSPDEIALKPADVPPEWRADVQEGSMTLENAAVALGTSVDNLQKWGYEAGFGSMLETADGRSAIACAVARFSGVGGARETFAHRKRAVVYPFTEVAVIQRVGDERVGYTQTILGYTMWGISFRKANVFVSLYVSGPTEMLSFDNVVAYAQLVEGRM